MKEGGSEQEEAEEAERRTFINALMQPVSVEAERNSKRISDRHIDIAILASAVEGAILALTAVVFGAMSTGSATWLLEHWVGIGFWTIFVGASVGGLAGIIGVHTKRFALSLLAGAALPLALILGVVVRAALDHIMPDGPVLSALTAGACFGGICCASAAIVGRATKWYTVRYSLRELIIMVTLCCIYFACLRLLFSMGS